MTRQQYIRQVIKHLKCSSSRKKEIGRQLDSHIELALSEGRALEEILKEMGEPEAIAEEFNENFDAEERKKSKKHKLAAVLAALSALVLAVGGLAAWWMIPKQREIADSRFFTEDALLARTEEVLEVFNRNDYDGLRECFAPEVTEVLEMEALAKSRALISDDWGEFRSMGHAYMAELSQRGVHTAIVQVNAAYDNVGVTFTLLYDRNMNLVGFYMK